MDKREEYFQKTSIRLDPLIYRREEVGFASNICVRIDLETLGEANDDFSTKEAILERVTLIVNDEIIEEISDYDALLTLNRILYEEGTYRYGGLTTICWKSELDIGLHRVVFQFARTNGEIEEYTWSFELF